MTNQTAEKIKQAAYRLFAEKSYDGTSVRDIAELAEVNVSAINYHFTSKEKLFTQLMTQIATQQVPQAMSFLTPPPETKAEFEIRLQLFFRSIIETSIKFPYQTKMFHLHLEKFVQENPEVFKETFYQTHLALHNFIRSSQEANLLNQNHEPEILVQIVFGGLFDMIGKQNTMKVFKSFDLTDENFQKKYIKTLIQSLGL